MLSYLFGSSKKENTTSDKQKKKSEQEEEAEPHLNPEETPIIVKVDRIKAKKMSQHHHYLKVLTSRNIDYTKSEIEKNAKRKTKKFEVEDLREMSYTLPTGYSFTIYRCYISTSDSKGLKDVGWVVNDKNSFCLLCFKDFGLTRWKHHCRACGTLVCKECSNYDSVLLTLEEYGVTKVCQSCHKPNLPATVLSTRRDGVSLIHEEQADSARVDTNNKATTSNKASTKTIQDSGNDNESERSTSEEFVYNQTIEVIPHPGFVVKTRREDDSKVFINIFHHESVSDEFLLLLRTVEAPQLPPGPPTLNQGPNHAGLTSPGGPSSSKKSLTTAKTKQPSLPSAAGETMMIPTIYLGEKKTTIDKNGAQSTLYNVVIASKYFEKESEKKVISSALVQKVIEAVNKNFHDRLIEAEYVRPRIKAGYQGLPIISPEVFVLNRLSVSMILRITEPEHGDRGSMGRRSVLADDDISAAVSAANSKPPAIGRGGGGDPLNANTTRRSPTAAVGGLARGDSANNFAADSASVVSDMTQSVATDASSTVSSQLVKLGSFFYPTANPAAATDGRSLLTSEMLRHAKELSITAKESSQLVEESTRKPQVLIGWQIMLLGDSENLNGVFVVTGTRKNNLRKSEFRVSNLILEDQWVKLRRNEQKTGIEFRPLRKVLSSM